MPSIIAPSILSADFSKLAAESAEVLALGGDWLHVDIMDGHFVPNLTFGFPVVKALHKALPDAFLDVHLMVSHPEFWVADAAKAGTGIFTFHLEAPSLRAKPEAFAAGLTDYERGDAIFRTISSHDFYLPDGLTDTEMATITQNALALVAKIRAHGMKPSLVIKPKTAVVAIPDALLHAVDMVLLMSVEPGFGGQSFMPACANKCAELKARRKDLLVEIDGGINAKTIDYAISKGVDVFVAGSYIFDAADRSAPIRHMRERFAAAAPQ